MKILIDIGHPAHVHYYKNFIKIMEQKGHEFIVIARDRECIHDLLRSEGIIFITRGSGATTIPGKVLYAIRADLKILFESLRFRPDLFLSHGSHYASHIAHFLKKKCICTGDSDHIRINAKLLIPLINSLLTPSSYKLNYGDKHIFYNSYTELLYLHPAYFIPNNNVLEQLGISKKEDYFIVRFISWNAFHDTGQNIIGVATKIEIVKTLSRYGKVLISSEGALPQELSGFIHEFPSDQFHNLLAGAKLVVSEGATTASEAAVLGTPVIYMNPLKVSYCTEQEEKYSLTYNFHNEIGLMEKLEDILQTSELKKVHEKRRARMLEEKIDATKFLIWFVENYPESHSIAKADIKFQERFK